MALLLTALIALLLVLVATDTALSVWQSLADEPVWMQLAYGGVLGVVILAAMALAWRWLKPRKAPPSREPAAVVTQETIAAGLQTSVEQGVDVSAAVQELAESQRRESGGDIYLAVFGEVSTGKSSLVSALVPGAKTSSDPRAGTTHEIRQYDWQADSGDRIVISDLPGFNQDDQAATLDEARRAHLVIFLCAGDLTQSQADELKLLQDLDKPVVFAINKSDRFDKDELKALRLRLTEQTGANPDDIVAIRSGGREEVISLLADGSERSTERDRPSDVEALRRRIQYHLDRNQQLMESLRQSAVLLLINEKLETARQQHREEQAAALVRKYSQRAVIGAMAAVAPGSDLVIQGVLATRLIQELCQLYEVSVKEVQIESFLKLAGGKVRKMSALTMAIAGNALKAFPGLGTLTGGLLHAVAYGMIFDSLGRAAAQTLASRGDFRPLPAARAFEEILSENLATGAQQFAQLAISKKTRPPSS